MGQETIMNNYPEGVTSYNDNNVCGVTQQQSQEGAVYYPVAPQIYVIAPPQAPTRLSTSILISHIILLIMVTSVEYLCAVLIFNSWEEYVWLAICLCFFTLCLFLDILALILRSDFVLIAATILRMGITICVIGATLFFAFVFIIFSYAFSHNATDFFSAIGYFALILGLPDLVYLILSFCLIFTMFKLCTNFAQIKKEKANNNNNINNINYDYNFVAGNNVELQTYSPDNNQFQV